MFENLAYFELAMIIVLVGGMLAALPVLFNGGGIDPDTVGKGWRRWLDQVGGYVHDTAMSQDIPPGQCLLTVGAWVDTVSPTTALVYMKKRTAAAATNQCIIPICLPQNSVAQKGAYLKSIDIWFETTVAAHTTLTALISRATKPADTVAYGAPAALAFTYDSLNDTNAKRVAVEQRKMTLTITTPFWVAADDQVYVDLTLIEAATTQFDFYGARANFTLRL